MKLFALAFMFFVSFMALATERVYLVDTGLRSTISKQCGPQINYSDVNIATHPHGTHMAIEIYNQAKSLDYCIQSYNIYDSKVQNITVRNIKKALSHILTQPKGIVNLSIQGTAKDYSEMVLIKKLADAGFIINIASGNQGKDLTLGCISYPACYFRIKYKNINVISNTDTYANINGPVTHVEQVPSTQPGTSGSTAMFSGKLVKKRLTGFRFYKVNRLRRNYVETL